MEYERKGYTIRNEESGLYFGFQGAPHCGVLADGSTEPVYFELKAHEDGNYFIHVGSEPNLVLDDANGERREYGCKVRDLIKKVLLTS